MRAGHLSAVWDVFDLKEARKIQGWTGSDQKWVNYILGPSVDVWPPSQAIVNISTLLKKSTGPPPETAVVVCSHKKKPWDLELRDANPWMDAAYPISRLRQAADEVHVARLLPDMTTPE
jgi:hypothetical protein